MYKRVFHKKFPDQSNATEYLDASGWDYIGRRGVFRPYHLYAGVSMCSNGRVSEHHKLRLYSDGYVAFYSEFKDNGTVGASGLPSRVWASKDIYDYLSKYVEQCNEKLATEFSNHYLIMDIGHKKYGVFKLQKIKNGIGSTIIKPAVKIFSGPKQAYDWAASSSQDI